MAFYRSCLCIRCDGSALFVQNILRRTVIKRGVKSKRQIDVNQMLRWPIGMFVCFFFFILYCYHWVGRVYNKNVLNI